MTVRTIDPENGLIIRELLIRTVWLTLMGQLEKLF